MPYGVAVDAQGNIDIADSLNCRIRQIDPDGGVTTLAGSFGRDAADGENPTFDYPAGIALDASGNLYIADSGDDMIRKMNRLNQVSSLAGQAGVTGASNGRGSDALFNNPWDVAVDAAGNVYVADTNNNMIRKIDPKGEVTTLAGGTAPGSADGTGTSASFNHPMGVAVDAAGIVYVADTANHLIRRITPKGEVTTLAGGGKGSAANGLGAAASFNWPTGIAVDGSGNIYVADSANLMIRKITPLGQVSTYAGPKIIGTDFGLTNSMGNVPVNTKIKFQPYGVALDANGNVYAVDPFDNLIRKIDKN
jgi:streptogramin lyase